MARLRDFEEYLVACRTTFDNCPEADRIALYTQYAERDRDAPTPLYRLAKACLDGGSRQLWHRGVALAMTLVHDTPRSLCERGDARLLLGDWGAWHDLESRAYHPDWGVSGASWLSWARARWDGAEDLSDKTLLVIQVGGFGDALLSLRFVEPLKGLGVGQLLWDTHPALMEFVKYNIGHLAQVAPVDCRAPAVRFDRYLYAMSLPHVVGRAPAFIRRVAPAPHARMPQSNDRARIGLAWACSIEGVDHLERSIPLSVLAPLFWRSDIEWYSLQVGPRAPDGDYYPGMRRPDPPLVTFSDTANLMANVDCVIAVDTSVAHIAGALGVPTVTLLRFASDSKWGGANSTPWYPSMRLIRQDTPGNWMSVIDDLREVLDTRWWLGAHPRTAHTNVAFEEGALTPEGGQVPWLQ